MIQDWSLKKVSYEWETKEAWFVQFTKKEIKRLLNFIIGILEWENCLQSIYRPDKKYIARDTGWRAKPENPQCAVEHNCNNNWMQK